MIIVTSLLHSYSTVVQMLSEIIGEGAGVVALFYGLWFKTDFSIFTAFLLNMVLVQKNINELTLQFSIPSVVAQP
jgi:hypothetical protein